MQQTSYTTRVLTPSKGHKITQADDNTSLQDRFFSDKVFLASTDKAENYKEITDAEAEELMRQQQELAEAQAKADIPLT